MDPDGLGAGGFDSWRQAAPRQDSTTEARDGFLSSLERAGDVGSATCFQLGHNHNQRPSGAASCNLPFRNVETEQALHRQRLSGEAEAPLAHHPFTPETDLGWQLQSSAFTEFNASLVELSEFGGQRQSVREQRRPLVNRQHTSVNDCSVNTALQGYAASTSRPDQLHDRFFRPLPRSDASAAVPVGEQATLIRHAAWGRQVGTEITMEAGGTGWGGCNKATTTPVAGLDFSSARERFCRVNSCNVPLENASRYSRRRKICKSCIVKTSVVVDGREMRYCQQCR